MGKIKLSLRPSFFSYIWSKKIYIFAFFIPVIIIYAAYAAFFVYPFGDESALVLDLSAQYVCYYENLRDVFWGDGSFVNSWSRNLSGETMGLFAYYLSSPFTIILMLLPRSMMPTSVLIMQLCKAGAAGVTFCYYLHCHRKFEPKNSLAFSILYSVMSYMIVQLMDPMWLDALVFLPLICIGIEYIVDHNRVAFFILFLSLMFIANFYIGWMIAIFSCLYFLVYYFALSNNNPSTKFGDIIYKGSQFTLGGVLSACCSAFILIPLNYSLSLGKYGFGNGLTSESFKHEIQFTFADIFVNALPNSYDTCRPEGSPVIYCGVITLILIPLFFLNTNIKLRTKIGYGILSFLLMASMYISTIDVIWHGFQVPNWLPYRYSFLLSFVMVLMAAHAFERIEGVSAKEIGIMFFLVCGYVLYVDSLELERINLLATIWYTVFFAGIYCLLLHLYKKYYKVKNISFIITIVFIIELACSSVFTIYAIDRDVNYSKYSGYNRYITLGRNTVDKIYEMDDTPVYRIESNHHRSVNDAMAFNSFGISHSSSTLNKGPIEFIRKLGFSYQGHSTKYVGATYISDALLGIKYVMEVGNTKPPKNEDGSPGTETEIKESFHYNDNMVFANGDSEQIFYVYENPNVLPIGFMASNDILDVKLEGDNPFIIQNNLMSALVNDTKADYFKRLEVDDVVPENAKLTTYSGHQKYVPRIEGENSHVEFFVTAPSEEMIYVYFPSRYERKVNLWLNKEFLGYYFETGNKTIRALGRFDEGEQISLITTLREEHNEVLFDDEYFYYLDDEEFQASIAELREEPFVVEEFKEDHIVGTVTAKEDGILYTSISYEPGWTVKVDGEKVEYIELVDALIGVPLSAGEHTIEMTFFPKGLLIGIIISAIAILITILIAIKEHKNRTILLNKLYEI